MDLRTRWGRNIAEARRRLGMSQTELGNAIPLQNKMSAHTVSRWERGITAPSDENRIRLAEILGVPVAILFPYPEQPDSNGGEAAA